MIVITNVEATEVDGEDHVTLASTFRQLDVLDSSGAFETPIDEVKVAKEIVFGKKYWNKNGKTVVAVPGVIADALRLEINSTHKYIAAMHRVAELEDELELSIVEKTVTEELFQEFTRRCWGSRVRAFLLEGWW